MSINAFQGSQCVGKVALANGSLSGSIPIFTSRKTASPYVLAASEILCVLSIMLSSNDTTNQLVSITDGASTPTTLMTCYVGSQAPSVINLPPGGLFGFAATNLVATAGAVTTAKQITVNLIGLVVNRS